MTCNPCRPELRGLGLRVYNVGLHKRGSEVAHDHSNGIHARIFFKRPHSLRSHSCNNARFVDATVLDVATQCGNAVKDPGLCRLSSRLTAGQQLLTVIAQFAMCFDCATKDGLLKFEEQRRRSSFRQAENDIN